MQLNDLQQVEPIAQKVNFSIFELPKSCDFTKIFPKSIHIAVEVNESTGKMRREIVKKQIEPIFKLINSKQTDDFYVIVEQAELLNEEASNMLLKSLEEPNQNIHYIFLTDNIERIMPTIRSRANHYYLKNTQKVTEAPDYDVEIFKFAKLYVGAKTLELPDIVDKILKHYKEDPRGAAIQIVECSIELMYKSYLLRGNQVFLQKIEKLIETKDALDKNGHIKLQLIANML